MILSEQFGNQCLTKQCENHDQVPARTHSVLTVHLTNNRASFAWENCLAPLIGDEITAWLPPPAGSRPELICDVTVTSQLGSTEGGSTIAGEEQVCFILWWRNDRWLFLWSLLCAVPVYGCHWYFVHETWGDRHKNAGRWSDLCVTGAQPDGMCYSNTSVRVTAASTR